MVKKTIPDIFDCNLRMPWPILIIFGNTCSKLIWLSNADRISHLTLGVLTHYLGKPVTSKNHDFGVILGNICRYQTTFKIICKALILLVIAKSSFICYYQLANGQQLCRPLQYPHACSSMHQSGPLAGFRLDMLRPWLTVTYILTLLYSPTSCSID